MSATHQPTSPIHNDSLRDTAAHAFNAVGSVLSAVVSPVAGAFSSLSHAIDASRELERVNMMSDADLKARGLTRDEARNLVITRHFG